MREVVAQVDRRCQPPGGCCDVLQPDVTLSTGIRNGKKVAGMAEAYNL